jgi:hypothetical protein
MARSIAAVAAACAAMVLAAPALAGHGLTKLDHAVPFTEGPPAPMTANSGGEGAEWEFVSSLATGNPHTDIDFFTQGDKIYASVGTLAVGPNAGGQTIVELADGDKVDPKVVSSHPTASCLSDPSLALSLQHDVEATPKGNALLNTDVLAAQRTDTQLLIDATDAEGRCHDQGTLGLAGAPKGGLEIIDVTDPANPVTIGLTSHIGEAHTVNVDPKRPHIAYAVTSDSVSTNAQGERTVETFDLDGFEVVDLSSCMNFPAGTTVEQKRAACRPQVWRYRYPSTEMSLGHTHPQNGVYGCHELEVYPDDRLTCGSGQAMIMLGLKGAFDDRGTPADFTDDRPRGTPLPCRVRDSSSTPPFTTGAKVIDCVATETEPDALGVPKWLAAGAPSLEGVEWLGSAFHPGREPTGEPDPAFDSTEDIDFDHEAELTHSGDFVLATDERGGGVAPPGASCSPGVDNKAGNGGVHAYRVDRLLRRRPTSPDDAHSSYARTPEGGKAIFRAPIRTGPQGSLCTAHVFHQIPGQNRIFMAWYSQGTRVIDFTEHADGRLSFKEVAWFIPANADEWVSAVFKVKRNPDGSFSYWGATGDFNVGAAGRNAVDVWKVTLQSPPPAPRGSLLPGTGAGFAPPDCVGRRARFRAGRLGRFRVGLSRRAVLRTKGRPLTRRGRVLTYCVKDNLRARVTLGFDRRGKLRFIASTARGHRAGKIRPGSPARTLRARRTRPLGRGVRAGGRGRIVFGIRGGRVRFIGTVDRRLARSARKVRAFVRLTRLR